MFKNSYNRFFPTPNFLEMPAFGLDISDESIKFIELRVKKDGISVGKYGERKIPKGVVESGKIIDPQKMIEILLVLKKEEGVRSVRVSILENQIYLFRFRLDKAGVTSVRESIELSLEEHIPVPGPEAIFDYDILSEDPKNLELQVAAIPKTTIEDYMLVFKEASISVHSFELEAQAIARAVVKNGDMNTYMIVDFGEKRTGIFIISKGIVMFTSTVDYGGVSLNEAIQRHFKISPEEAEKLKKDYGLQRNVMNKEIFPVLLNSVSILRDEISRHFVYWHTHTDDEGKDNTPIEKIILCGGDSNLIGLPDYFAVSLKTKVEMANVWVNILNTNNHIPDIGSKYALSFAAAIGLALGDIKY